MLEKNLLKKRTGPIRVRLERLEAHAAHPLAMRRSRHQNIRITVPARRQIVPWINWARLYGVGSSVLLSVRAGAHNARTVDKNDHMLTTGLRDRIAAGRLFSVVPEERFRTA